MPLHRVFRRRTEKAEARPSLEVLLKDELEEAARRLKAFSDEVKDELNVIDNNRLRNGTEIDDA
jgi:hypothetical protein